MNNVFDVVGWIDERTKVPVTICLTDAVDSYDNSADYDTLPNDTGEGVNSNSFVGSVLRKSGSDFTPSRNAPGFGKNIFTQPKSTTITLSQRASKAYQSVKKVITDFF